MMATAGLRVAAMIAMTTILPSRATNSWSDLSVTEFDCDVNVNPIQVLRYDDADLYSVRELDTDTGDYELIFTIDWCVDCHINAAAMTAIDGAYYSFASFDGFLCRFDSETNICFDTPLEYAQPNVGAIIGSDYFYSRNLGADAGASVCFNNKLRVCVCVCV